MKKWNEKKIFYSLALVMLVYCISIVPLIQLESFSGIKKIVQGHDLPKVSQLDTVKKVISKKGMIRPTTLPYTLKKHLSDFALTEGKAVDLLSTYPSTINQHNAVASQTFRQFTLGSVNSCYRLGLQWNSKFPIDLKLFDRIGQPIAHYSGKSGTEEIPLHGSVYKVGLSYHGKFSGSRNSWKRILELPLSDWTKDEAGLKLPKSFELSQDGKGARVFYKPEAGERGGERGIDRALYLSSSSRGNAALRYRTTNLSRLRGKWVRVSGWMKSSNENSSLAEMGLREGGGLLTSKSYANSGGWEKIVVSSELSENADELQVVWNIRSKEPGGIYIKDFMIETIVAPTVPEMLASNNPFIVFETKEVVTCSEDALGVPGDFVDIPELKIRFSRNTHMAMKYLRKSYRQKLTDKGNTGNPIATVNKKSLARLQQAGAEESDIQIWLAGVGDPRHFDEAHPSFTVKLVSGPLFHGMSRFKLYSIEVKEGLLDYVVGKLAAKEGIFVPRWMLVNLTLGDKPAGLYVLEETPSPEFFASKDRFEGLVYSSGENYYLPKLLRRNDFLDSGNLDEILSSLNPVLFGKMIALLSRFNATHGLQGHDLRFSQDPVTGASEPVIRDINVNHWAQEGLGVRSLLTHSSWWLGEKPSISGSHFNLKTYPLNVPWKEDANDFSTEASLQQAYSMHDTTLGLAHLNPVMQEFVKVPENREIFEKFLIYFSDPAFKRNFQHLLVETFRMAEPFLDKNKLILKIIQRQVTGEFGGEGITIGEYARPLMNKSRILAVPVNRQDSKVDYALLNLSPYSIRIRSDFLPSWGRLIDEDIPVNEDGYYLAPSKYFAMAINNLYKKEDSYTLGKLSQSSIHKIVQLEQSSYLNEYLGGGVDAGPKPFVRVRMSESDEHEFKSGLKTSKAFLLADRSSLRASQIMFVDDFPKDRPSKIIPNINRNRTDLVPELLRQDLLAQCIGQYPVKDGYVLRYLLLNQSSQPVEMNLKTAVEKLPYLVKARALMVGEEGIIDPGSSMVLSAMKEGPIKKSTRLWIDNLIPLLNGSEGKSNVALVDFHIDVENNPGSFVDAQFVNKNSGYKILPQPSYLLAALQGNKNVSGRAVVIHEPHWIPLYPNRTVQSNDEKVAQKTKNIRTKEIRLGKDEYDEVIVINEGEVLVVGPGRKIRFSENAGILVFGGLRMEGTAEANIELLPQKKEWLGITLLKSRKEGGPDILKYARLLGAQGGKMEPVKMLGGLEIINADLILDNVSLEDFGSDDTLHLYNSTFKLNGLHIKGGVGDGVDSDWSYGSILNGNFEFCGGDCLDFSGSLVEVTGNKIHSATDKGISVGERSMIVAVGNNISSSMIGVAVKDGSVLRGENNRIVGSRTAGIVSYLKKPYYSRPWMHLKNSKFADNEEDTIQDKFDFVIRGYDG